MLKFIARLFDRCLMDYLENYKAWGDALLEVDRADEIVDKEFAYLKSLIGQHEKFMEQDCKVIGALMNYHDVLKLTEAYRVLDDVLGKELDS